MDIEKIMKECITMASIVAGSKLEQLELAGPKYQVYDDNLFDSKIEKKVVGTMLDNCGGSYLIIPGRSKFVNSIKKQFKNEGDSYNPRFSGENWSLWKDVYKGYCLSLRFLNCQRQEVSIHSSAMEVVKEVLLKYGIESRVYTYID